MTTGLAPLVKVQGVTQRASWFQRRLGLATVTAHVAGPGGDLTILDLGDGDGRQLRAGLVVAAAAARAWTSPTPGCSRSTSGASEGSTK